MNYKKMISGCLPGKSNHNASVLIALVAGAAAGAIVSLLLAPQSGAETRDMISEKAKGLAGDVKDKLKTAKDKFRSGAQQVADDAKDQFNHFS
jgi:gas vesicle protein